MPIDRAASISLAGDGAQAAAEDFRRIAGRAERQRQHGADEGLAQERPEEAVADEAELAETIEDQEHLDQQRRAAEDEDVALGEIASSGVAADAHPDDDKRQHAAEEDGKGKQRQRHRQSGQQGFHGLEA